MSYFKNKEIIFLVSKSVLNFRVNLVSEYKWVLQSHINFFVNETVIFWVTLLATKNDFYRHTVSQKSVFVGFLTGKSVKHRSGMVSRLQWLVRWHSSLEYTCQHTAHNTHTHLQSNNIMQIAVYNVTPNYTAPFRSCNWHRGCHNNQHNQHNQHKQHL